MDESGPLCHGALLLLMDAAGKPDPPSQAPRPIPSVSHLTRRLWKSDGRSWLRSLIQTSSLAQLALVSQRWTPGAPLKFDCAVLQGPGDATSSCFHKLKSRSSEQVVQNAAPCVKYFTLSLSAAFGTHRGFCLWVWMGDRTNGV